MIRPLVPACLTALLFALTAAAPARAQDAGCFKDTDCKGSRICVDKLCVDPPAVKACGRDLDCPGDDICEQHICLPPANSKAKKKAKSGHRDLIKEARDASANQPAAAAPASPPASDADNAPPLVSLPTPAPPPPAPKPVPPPAAPPMLIESNGPSSSPPPAIATPPPEETPATPTTGTSNSSSSSSSGSTTPAPMATTPAPAPVETSPVAPPPPAPPDDLITAMPPPPPLVAAPAVIPPTNADETPRGATPGSFLGGGAVSLGFHSWSATGASETDFGLDINGDLGVRVSGNIGIELLLQGGYTAMLGSRTGLVAGVGLGLRLDHLGRLPGHFLVGGLGSFGAISADSAATINVSGGEVQLQYAFPLVGPLSLLGQAGLHFLGSNSASTGNLTLFTFTVGVQIGN